MNNNKLAAVAMGCITVSVVAFFHLCEIAIKHS